MEKPVSHALRSRPDSHYAEKRARLVLDIIQYVLTLGIYFNNIDPSVSLLPGIIVIIILTLSQFIFLLDIFDYIMGLPNGLYKIEMASKSLLYVVMLCNGCAVGMGVVSRSGIVLLKNQI